MVVVMVAAEMEQGYSVGHSEAKVAAVDQPWVQEEAGWGVAPRVEGETVAVALAVVTLAVVTLAAVTLAGAVKETGQVVVTAAAEAADWGSQQAPVEAWMVVARAVGALGRAETVAAAEEVVAKEEEALAMAMQTALRAWVVGRQGIHLGRLVVTLVVVVMGEGGRGVVAMAEVARVAVVLVLPVVAATVVNAARMEAAVAFHLEPLVAELVTVELEKAAMVMASKVLVVLEAVASEAGAMAEEELVVAAMEVSQVGAEAPVALWQECLVVELEVGARAVAVMVAEGTAAAVMVAAE